MTTTNDLDPRLLGILACPEDKGPLLYFPSESILFNPRLARTYAIRDGIPVMLIEESTQVDATEVKRLEELAAKEGIEPNFEA